MEKLKEERVCDEIIELDDILAQLESHYGPYGAENRFLVASQLMLVRQLRFLRDDLANK